jgi:hypothetical protein
MTNAAAKGRQRPLVRLEGETRNAEWRAATSRKGLLILAELIPPLLPVDSFGARAICSSSPTSERAGRAPRCIPPSSARGFSSLLFAKRNGVSLAGAETASDVRPDVSGF